VSGIGEGDVQTKGEVGVTEGTVASVLRKSKCESDY